MPNRIQLDIDGSIYTFPINPVGYSSQENEQHSLTSTIDGGAMRFTPAFDDRKRVMRWRGIPNKPPFDTLIPNLQSAIGIDGVRLRHRDLSVSGNDYVWKSIRVENVHVKPVDKISDVATGKLKHDITLEFSYIRNLFEYWAYYWYSPLDYFQPWWDNLISHQQIDIVCVSPALGELQYQAIRNGFPNAKLLMMGAIANHDLFNLGNQDYRKDMNDALMRVSGYFLTRDDTNNAFVESDDNNVITLAPEEFGKKQEGEDSVIDVMVNNMNGGYYATFDGIYLDNFGMPNDATVGAWPGWAAHYPYNLGSDVRDFIAGGGAIDYDGSQTFPIDTVEKWETICEPLWPAWRNIFASGLRSAMGEDKILMGNGYGTSCGALNGLTIERPIESGADLDVYNTWIANQKAVSEHDSIQVLWCYDSSPTVSGLVERFSANRLDVRYGFHRNIFTG
jgi:hypothetical protein